MTSKNDLISVIIPVYNVEQYVEKSIRSILNQTYTNLQVIIIEDASTDNTLEVIKSIKDERITLIENKTNKGIGYNGNIGLQLAKGKYIVRQDSDDYSYPERIQKQYNYLEQNPEVVVVGSQIRKVFPNGEFKTENKTNNNLFTFSGCPVFNPSCMFRLDFVKKHNITYVNYLPEDYTFFNDIFIANEYASNTFYNLADTLVDYTIRPDQITASTSKRVNEYTKGYQMKYFKKFIKHHNDTISLFEINTLNNAIHLSNIWKDLELNNYTINQKREFWNIIARDILFESNLKLSLVNALKFYNKNEIWGRKGYLTILKKYLTKRS